MKKLLNQKEQWYADTLPEAKEIVNEAQEKGNLTSQKITGKSNKFGPYNLVDLTFSYETPRNLMEEREDGAPEGQMDMDDMHEGVPYTVDSGGGVTMENTDEELQGFEDPFEEKEDEEKKEDVTDEELPY
ncbi:organic solvent tolerance protein OstA [Lysinibacillus sp. NPDC096418]|uniref:organic solvent tolerance protein OstA n=1 Tax=Lysinibacillus sp. NPDC096418 TaxID=3364138 RepID=UPI00381A8DD5